METPSYSFPAPGHRNPRPFNAFQRGGVDGRGRLKAEETAARIQGGHRCRDAPGAEVHHQLALVGIGADEILAQGHRLLRGMYAAGHRGECQHIAGEMCIRDRSGPNRWPPPVPAGPQP